MYLPTNAYLRTASNFYASRQDGLTRSDDAHGRYIAPVGVVTAFAEANPNGGQVFYTVVGYSDDQGATPTPAASPEVLAVAAATVPMLLGFRGHTRTETLGVPLSMLKPAARLVPLEPGPHRRGIHETDYADRASHDQCLYPVAERIRSRTGGETRDG